MDCKIYNSKNKIFFFMHEGRNVCGASSKTVGLCYIISYNFGNMFILLFFIMKNNISHVINMLVVPLHLYKIAQNESFTL